MKRPLVIYLDSSDFSDLADPRKRSPQLVAVEEYLMKLQENGVIELRFSHLHVIEAAATKQQYSEIARLRFSTIKKLCDFKCFKSHISILEAEAIYLSQVKSDDQITIYEDFGNWFPKFEDCEDVDDLGLIFKEAISSIPDRKTRRVKERLYLDSKGMLNLNGRNELIKTSGLMDNIAAKLPLPRPVIPKSIQAYLKTGSAAVFLNNLKVYMSDLEVIGLWYEKDWDRISPISSYLREIGGDLKESLAEYTSQLQGAAEALKLSNTDKHAIEKMLNDGFERAMTNIPRDLAHKLTTHLGINCGTDPTWEASPTLMTIAQVAGSVGKITSASERKARTSDFGDIYHTVYLPYVDIFRADGFTASAIKEANLPFDTFIVDKFIKLPEAIESLVNKAI